MVILSYILFWGGIFVENVAINSLDAFCGSIIYIIAYSTISPYKFKLKDFLFMGISMIISALIFSTVHPNLLSMSVYAVPILFIYIKSRSIKESIVLQLIILITITVTDIIVGLIGCGFVDGVLEKHSKEHVIICLCIYFALYFSGKLVGRLYKKYRDFVVENYKSKYVILFNSTLVVTFFIFYMNMNWNASKAPHYLAKANGIGFIAYFIILMFICFNLIFSAKKEVKFKSKQIQFEQLQEYTNNLENLYMDMRKFRHDYINILSSISGFLQDDDIKGLEKYFNNHIYPLNSIMEKNNFKLGLLKNIKIPEVKGLISAKLIRAQELKLNVSIDIVEPIEHINMDVVDLVRCLGILLDNAIEAAIKSDDKKVELGVIKKTSSIIVVVINSYNKDIPPIGKMFKEGFSTKGKNRGIGLSNLKNIINKSKDVFLDTYIENGEFVQCINIGQGEKKCAIGI